MTIYKGQKKDESERIWKGLLVVLCFSIMVLSLFCAKKTSAAEAEHQTVKVGYYPVANFQNVNEDGTYSGFSYDYYMQIQKYTRWNYEFVEASYAECMKMLLSGDIDVMYGVGKTEAREKQMLFSDFAISNSQNKLYARADNDDLYYESFDTFDGCRIAMMRGMLTDEVEAYCKENNFQAEIVQYDSLEEMTNAVLSGEVDMLCASSVSNDTDTKIVGRMDKQPLYFVTSMNRPDIDQALDNALRKIVDNNPDFYTQLSEKYMISGANATATFTREETQYIQSGPQVYIIVNPEWAPITWYDKTSGEYKGVFIDVIKKIEEYSGLKFNLCTEAEFNEQAALNPDMENNVVAILADDNSWAVKQNVMMSNHVVDSSVLMVTKRGVRQGDITAHSTIAMPERFYISYIMREALKGKTVVECSDVEECLEAVNNGDADATYVNELVSTYYLSTLKFSNLYATANTGYFENLAFAVNKDSDVPLLSILDKSLLCLGSTDINQIVVQNSIAEERFSLQGLYYTNPELVVGAAVAAAIVILIVIFIIYQILRKRKLAELELRKEAETSAARTEFFMMISHELRTPLNAIVGYLNLVAEEHRKNRWDMEYVRRSQNAARQMTEIAEDMLDYTRIASDTVDLKEELFDLKDVIMHADQNVSLKAAEKELHYRITVHDMQHEYVVGDHLRVSQIFQNILSNGVKFTNPGGKVEADIREEMAEDGRIKLTFICKDSGKGMTEEFIRKICAPFNQNDKSYSRTHGGLGLGLYLTQYFVKAMGGTLQVESKLGEGSCFTVSLYLKKPNSEQILNSHIECSHVRAIACGENPDDNINLKNLLKRLKIKCDAVLDGDKLRKRIISRSGGEFEYTLCILDDTILKAEPEIVAEIAAMEHAPTMFAITSDSQLIDQLSVDKNITQVLYKPIFQSVLFDAVMDTFGEYRPEHESEHTRDFTGLRAMVVEDNSVNADILSRVLTKANMEVTVCENGQIAVDTFEQSEDNTFQIVFMDIQMPVMNGYEATEKIRQSKKEQGKTIPIVAVSANAFPEDMEKSMKAGMNEHLSKPINAHRIYEVTDEYVIR